MKSAPDVEGQMLAAMVVAQYENGHKNPVYGCFIQGKSRIFTTLHQSDYCISRQFDATQEEDLFQIFYALRRLSVLILLQIASSV
jgi:hypothetical protein